MATQAERRAATTGALLKTARKLFGERGYADVSIEEIAREAGVTRGALYHHFKSKEDLFAALFEAMEQELVMRATEAGSGAPDAWGRLLAGSRAFLQKISEPEMRRVVLLDAPAVLGWERWREIDMRYGLWAMRVAIEAAMRSGEMRERPLEPLTHMLLGALMEAAMMVGPNTSGEVAAAEFESLLESLR